MSDRIDEARALAHVAEQRSRELGREAYAPSGELEALSGNHEVAADQIAAWCAYLEKRGQRRGFPDTRQRIAGSCVWPGATRRLHNAPHRPASSPPTQPTRPPHRVALAAGHRARRHPTEASTQRQSGSREKH